jgi:serine/threonine protein kinase
MPKHPAHVRINGKRWPVLEQLRIGGRKLLVVERLGHFSRPTFRAVECGVTQEVRCVQLLPHSKATLARLRVLSRVSRAQANLPAIVGTHRSGETVYLITRWIDGPTLGSYLGQCRSGREPWPSALVVVQLICGLTHGLRLLHDRLGIVHGDVHPDNLILCRHTKRLVPIDFGNAFPVERTAVAPAGDGAVRAYTAPEVHAGQPLRFYSDQFSVMAVLYQLLTGQIPYDGLGGRVALANERSEQRIVLGRTSKQLRHAAKLPSDASQELDALLEQGLAVEPSQRFQTTQEWIAALTDVKQILGAPAAPLSSINRLLLALIDRLNRLLDGQ